ncbi:MAG: hypothetical protein Q4D12_00765 [Bacteroidales bacterium]|nr:hypothetical protein [Bacteroidales bacterium]
MKRELLFSMSLALVAALSSCSSKLGALSADNFTVTPNPLEAHAGVVPATINGNFPEKYMKKKAVVTVTPVLKFNGQTLAGQPTTFQGEKVQGNGQSISYKVGGHYTMRTAYAYQPAMANSDLYLQFDAKVGKKTVSVPEVKIANGVIATSELVKRTLSSANPSFGKDAFQRSIQQKQTATIQFLLGQANLRASELKSDNIKEFLAKLEEIKNNPEGNILNNVEVSAYASPDGKYSFNEKLAGKRESVSTDYLKKQLKKTELDTNIDTKYTAEDWEGFQELVAQSSIQDKDLILRVLNMYTEPEEREREIRNIATVYKDLADGILPQLRRARLTANYEIIGRSDDEIVAQLKADPKQLSVEELIYGATIVNNPKEKEAFYQAAAKQYPKDARAFNNLGALAYQSGNTDAAASYFAQAQKAANSSEANANLGLLALLKGNKDEAAQYLAKASGAEGLNEAMGALNIAQGQYAAAANALKGTKTNTEALAQILNKDYTSAAATLTSVKNQDAMTDYLKAILSARTNDASGVSTYLKKAVAADAALKQLAKTDLEFAKFADAVKSL